MCRFIFILSGFCLCCVVCKAQPPGERMLFVIDSVAIITDPEDWNPISGKDIAGQNVIRNKDSIKLLGWPQVDGITYVFTKAYRSRTDSINRIPGLRRMEEKNGNWCFHNVLYSGTYIDYYNNGDMQSKGTITSGKVNGTVTIYYKNGALQSVSEYKNGVLDGLVKKYYKNGVLMEESVSAAGKNMIDIKWYFLNGQLQNEVRKSKDTPYDTLVTYYSTGRIKSIYVKKTKEHIRSRREEDIAYYFTMFLQAENTRNIKDMRKNLDHLWALDSNNTDTRSMEGRLLAAESHFDKAIADFDKVLQTEPLDREALLQRALARLKQQHVRRAGLTANKPGNEPATIDDLTSLPAEEQQAVCADLLLANQLDHTDFVVSKRIPAGMLSYCNK